MSLTSKSKFLSKVLRHDPGCIGITLEPEGWANVKDILVGLDITMTILEIIVETDEKNRYSFNEDKTKIRANQGHSTSQVNMTFKPYTETKDLYHGTSIDTIASIVKSGSIVPMSRQYVHLSRDKETAFSVGKRHCNKGSFPVICVINTAKMEEDGIKRYISDNGVVLVKEVPVKYIKGIIFTAKSDKLTNIISIDDAMKKQKEYFMI